MSKDEQLENVLSAKKLAKWFELDINIKLFGHTIFHWHYPPQND